MGASADRGALMRERIFRYVVRHDAGAAPNPFGDWCTLAVCKPQIRQSASVGDWIVGLRSRQPDHVIYAMQVSEILTFAAYWNDKRFRHKRPDRCASSDSIYRPDFAKGLAQVPNRVHTERDRRRDLSCINVLVSSRFWYFGALSPQLPAGLAHLVHRGRGHSVEKNRREDDVACLDEWLRAQGRIGIHGAPLDRHRLLPALTDSRTCAAPKVRSKAPKELRPKSRGCD